MQRVKLGCLWPSRLAIHVGGAPPCAACTCLLHSYRRRSARSSYCTLFNNCCVLSACSCISQNTYHRRASAVRFSAFWLRNPTQTCCRDVHGGLWPRHNRTSGMQPSHDQRRVPMETPRTNCAVSENHLSMPAVRFTFIPLTKDQKRENVSMWWRHYEDVFHEFRAWAVTDSMMIWTKISTKMEKNHTKIHVTTIKWWRHPSRDTQGDKISPKKVTPTHKNYTETDNLLQDPRDHHEVMMSFVQTVLTLWQHAVVCTHTIKLPVLEWWSLTYHWQTSKVCR